MLLKKLTKLIDNMVLSDNGFDDNTDVKVVDTEGNEFYIQGVTMEQKSLFDEEKIIKLKVRKNKW